MHRGKTRNTTYQALAVLALTFSALTHNSTAHAADMSEPAFFNHLTVRPQWLLAAAAATDAPASMGRAAFENSIKWQSSFSIAGSRVWSKVVKFSRTGIDIRVPLN
jgi:hypothetical protein